MAKHQIRLEKDVAGFVKSAAKKYGRSIPKEVNFQLRSVYQTKACETPDANKAAK